MRGEVRFDGGSRALYANDASVYRQVPIGVVYDQLRDPAAEHGLTFPPDPATHDRCTVGGMIGNNSCGTHSQLGAGAAAGTAAARRTKR